MQQELQLDWVSSFLAVVDQGTFTAAADAVHRSQPRVSAHVGALERALGVPLFHRTGRQVLLTDAGKLFLPRARSAVLELDAAADEVTELAVLTRGHLVIGSYPSASATVLAPVLREFADRYPAVTFEVHEGPATWSEEVVASGAVDIAIRGRDPLPRSSHIACQPLFEEPVVAVATLDHGIANPTLPLVEGLRGDRILTTGEPGRGRTIGYDYEQLLEEMQIGFDQRLVLSQPTTVIALVRAGLGVGVLGALAAHTAGTEGLALRTLPRRDPFLRYICAFRDKTRHLSPAATVFLKHLYAAEPPTGAKALHPQHGD